MIRVFFNQQVNWRHCSRALIHVATLIAFFCPASQQHLRADEYEEQVLSPTQWKRVDESVDRGLRWLASQQQSDGSFPTRTEAQPAVTALSAMSFLANGYSADEGPFSDTIRRAIRYTAARQQSNGLIALVSGSRGPKLTRNVVHSIGRTAVYNHAISSLVLSEAYGQHASSDAEELRLTIQRALAATLKMQAWPGKTKIDEGGWRYLDKITGTDSDLSITGWQLMFLRSAKNAGFDVPQKNIHDAVRYVRNCFEKQHASFTYMADSRKHVTRAMAVAGILALAHAGFHNSTEAQQAGDWLLKHSFEDYGELLHGIAAKGHHDRYHYGLVLCSQGMYQLGGKHWQAFFPVVSTTLLRAQQSSGAWSANRRDPDRIYGKCYTTSLCLLSLSASNQLLPIFQR